METSLKSGFAQNFSRCPKNLSCPKIWGGSPPRPVRLCLQLIFTVLFIYISVLIWNILFHSDHVLPAWKVSAELSVVSGGPEKTQKCCFIYFLTGNFQKLFVNHIGVLFFPAIF